MGNSSIEADFFRHCVISKGPYDPDLRKKEIYAEARCLKKLSRKQKIQYRELIMKEEINWDDYFAIQSGK